MNTFEAQSNKLSGSKGDMEDLLGPCWVHLNCFKYVTGITVYLYVDVAVCMSLFYIDSMCIPTGDEWLLTANFNQPEDEPPEPSTTPVTARPDGSVVAAAPTVAAVAHLHILHANSQRSQSASGMCHWRPYSDQVWTAVHLVVFCTKIIIKPFMSNTSHLLCMGYMFWPLPGHHQAFLQIKWVSAAYMLGSQLCL
jgi:hypothetical protein